LTVYCLPLSVTSLILSIEYTTKDWDLLSPYCGLSYSFLYLAPLDKETEMLQIYKLVWVPNDNNVLNVSCLSVKK